LRNINLEVREGEFISIMGPSGSGKSTVLHVLGLHDSAWSGEYWFAGEAVHKMDKKKRFDLQKKNIGFIFQSYHLLDDLTVYENLEIPLSYRDVPKKQRESIVCDVLDRFQIVGKKDLYPNQLSGGQQQLVGVARALVAKPRLLLADEPTGNLHSDQGRDIMQLFKNLNENDGVTIVQVTHSRDNAAFGSRIVRLADGMIVP
jgi:ABC-type lipoprotein export system ATPase subunit